MGMHQSALERHLTLSNQEGKMFYATCLDYFVDLAALADELDAKGLFDKYKSPANDACLYGREGMDEDDENE
jgi:hypothetical protein